MDEFITEKNYPIRSIWLLKLIFQNGIFFFSIIIMYFIIIEISKLQYPIYLFLMLFFIPIILQLFGLILQRINFHYAIENNFLKLNQGVISKKQGNIPYGVIQDIMLKQDLFDKIFNLATLIIENISHGGNNDVSYRRRSLFEYQIGSTGNKIYIPGLLKEDAESLRDVILQKMKENPMVENQSGL